MSPIFCLRARASTQGPGSRSTTATRKRAPFILADLLHVCIHIHTVCCVSQQTCLLCHTAEISAVSHRRHVCWVTQRTCLLFPTVHMSVVSQSRHFSCVDLLWHRRFRFGSLSPWYISIHAHYIDDFALLIFMYMYRSEATSRFSGELETLKATHKTD